MSPDTKSKGTKVSLRLIFGVVTLASVEIWLLQQGSGFILFVPLFIAIAFELAGYHQAAKYAAIFTMLFWLCFPCVLAIFR